MCPLESIWFHLTIGRFRIILRIDELLDTDPVLPRETCRSNKGRRLFFNRLCTTL